MKGVPNPVDLPIISGHILSTGLEVTPWTRADEVRSHPPGRGGDPGMISHNILMGVWAPRYESS